MRAPAVGLLLLLCCCAAAVRAIEPGQRAESWSLLSSEGMEIDFPRIAEITPSLNLVFPHFEMPENILKNYNAVINQNTHH